MCFFKVKHSIGHISGMVGPIDVKWKGGTSVRYWVNYVTLTFDLTHDVDLWFFKVKFQNSCNWGIVIWLMWNKKKANHLDTGLYSLALWPHPWPWPCSLNVRVWNSLIWGMGVGALIDTERKGCESIIHDHDCDLWVTMVGWVYVPYSDWGDFRRRRAVDISSSSCEAIFHLHSTGSQNFRSKKYDVQEDFNWNQMLISDSHFCLCLNYFVVKHVFVKW